MNKIYKVIWNKTRGMYMVVSELAKGQSKDGRRAVGRKKVAQTAAALAVFFSIVSMGGTSYAAGITIGTATVTDSSGNTVTVFTGNSSAASAVEAAVELTVPYNSKQIGILQDAVQSVEDELAQHQNIIDNLGTDKLTLSADNTLQKESYDSATKTTKKTDVTGLKVTGPISAESGKITNSLEVGHNANVGGAVNAGSLNSRGNLNVDGNALVKGTLTSQSTINGNEIVSQTNITAKNKVVGMQGVVDNTLTSGNYVTAGNTVGENIVALDTQVKANADAITSEAQARQDADNELNERITNEANAIHETTNQLQSDLNTETAAREAADTALDTRITNVKEYLEKQTSDNYVSKADAAVQDGAIVKAANTIGENVTNLDAALAKETAARIGADAAQDKVIEQVNQNMVDGFNTINTNMANGFAALNAADAAEKDARIGADKKLAEAVNSGLSLSDDNVLQKNTTTVADDGTVTTSKSDAKEMILNKDKDNQITLNEKGIKVGTNSSVMDKDGVYTGGDTFDAAKAAMKSDGQIKGANGKFTVDASGNTTVTSLDAGTGTIQTKGDLYAKDATFSGDITAKDATLSGDLSAKDGTFSGDLSAKDGTFSGDVSAKDVTATGTLQGAEVTDGTAIMKNGNITGVKDLSAETITTSGDATIGGDLTVKGKLNVDEIDLTKNGIVGDNNVTASTKVAAGEITGYKKATSTKDGSEKESAIDYDENGTSTWAKSTDADGNWKKSTLTVEGSDVTSKVVDSDKNSNESKQTSTESSDVVTDANGNTSTFRQRVDAILQEIKNADGDTLTKVEQTDTAITSQIGDGSAVKSEMTADGITNTAVGGTITNSAKDLVNTATGDMTNTVGGKMLNDVTGDMENKVGGNLTTMVGGNETHTVGGTLTKTVTGKATENYNGGLETTITGEEKHTVNGDQTNTITGKQTTTVIGDVTEDYKANLDTKIGGNQSTEVTGDSSLTAENITNEAKNKITNKALDVETDASSSIVSKVFNEYGSNTSTQLSYQTTEEMSQADGKKASYLRGAAEEKSQLTDGDKKTTIDTIAGQTNTNITDGTNTSNSLQKADQVASSVTDGTNTTVVNQDARSIASSITDGTKANNTNSTVDKSEQLIKASDSQYNASVKTATASAERLVSGNIIDILKDAENGYVNTTVTSSDGASSTSVQQGNKDITNTAKQGTITNEAKNLVNKAEEKLSNSAAEIENTAATSIKDVVGKSTVTTTDTGTTFENSDHAAAIGEGSITQTTISGNTLETGKVTADYVDVNKNLDVKGTTTTDKLVVNNGATVTGGTTTDTLHVTSTSTFDGMATFKDAVSMEKDLSVGGNATVAGDVSAKSYKVADKTYIDQNGINANSQKVTNVADGDVSEGSTDAVNGGQLHATNKRVSTVENRMDGVENRVDRVENRVDNLDNRIDKVGASAAAMANLHPMDFDEDSKVSVAAAVGSYRSETAGALGVFYRPTDRVMMNVSTSFGNGENMVGGGVSFKLGKSSKRLQQAEATNAALSKQVANLQNRLDALLGVLNPNLSKAFPDVPANHWAYEAVSKLAGNDIVQGYEDGKYHGERTMSRYEMAEIIYNALSKGAKAEAKLVEEFRPELQAMAAQRKA